MRRLNRKLVLEGPVRAPDGGGGARQTWVARGVHWAAVEAATGAERAGEALTLSGVPVRVFVRGAPVGSPARPRPDDRFREGQRLFRILSVTEADADGRYLVCQAREEVVA
jgi:head-tail adaptor